MFRSFDRDVILKKVGERKWELDAVEEKSRKKRIHLNVSKLWSRCNFEKDGGKGELDAAEEKSRKKKIHYLDVSKLWSRCNFEKNGREEVRTWYGGREISEEKDPLFKYFKALIEM